MLRPRFGPAGKEIVMTTKEKMWVARELQMWVSFAVPYAVAWPLFLLAGRMSGTGQALAVPEDFTPIVWATLAGLAGVVASRRGWIAKTGVGLIYLALTVIGLTFWAAFAALSRESL
jgi:hypothetical protein